jgi:hypothetical protein
MTAVPMPAFDVCRLKARAAMIVRAGSPGRMFEGTLLLPDRQHSLSPPADCLGNVGRNDTYY